MPERPQSRDYGRAPTEDDLLGDPDEVRTPVIEIKLMKPVRISEVSTLTLCERKWWYRYAEGADEFSPAMTLGTLLHAWVQEWWVTPGGYRDIDFAKVLARIPEDRQDLITEEIRSTAEWLLLRYDHVYQPTHHEWTVEGIEVEMEVDLGGGLLAQGRADLFVYHKPTKLLFLDETKSMNDWRRLETLTVDPQVTHYYALARRSGYDIEGVLYDAIRTYRWKRDPHPPEDSFQRIYLDRTEDQVTQGYLELQAFADRRTALEDQGAGPLRSISDRNCSWCAFKARCWEELAFPEPTIEIIEE